MKFLIFLILLAGCRGSDLAPDYFEVHAGRGDSEGTTGLRETDSETDYAGVTLGWHLDEGEKRQAASEHETAYAAALHELGRNVVGAIQAIPQATAPAVAPPAPVQPAPHPEAPEPAHAAAVEPEKQPAGGAPWWAVYLPAGTTLALGLIGILAKRGKVDWLEHKGGGHA